MADVTAIPLTDDTIRLGQFLKLTGVADSGGQARLLLADGQVTVNDEPESRRGRQLVPGDRVRLDLATGPQDFVVTAAHETM